MIASVIPNPPRRMGELLAADGKEKADSSGKLRPRNDSFHATRTSC